MKSRITMYILVALLCSSFIYCQLQDAITQEDTQAISGVNTEAPAVQASIDIKSDAQASNSAGKALEVKEGLADEQPLGLTEVTEAKEQDLSPRSPTSTGSVRAVKKVQTPKKESRRTKISNGKKKQKSETRKTALAKKKEKIAESSAVTKTEKAQAQKIEKKSSAEKKAGKKAKVSSAQIEALIETWEETPRQAAQKLIKKYGLPQEFSQSDLIWYNNGPWKYTVVSNELIPHNYPHPHYDSVLQVIDYPITNKAFNELKNPEAPVKLLDFNGSITFDRTRGELGAHCDSEGINFLLINTAHDIINNKKTVADAREFFTNRVIQYLKGVPSKLTSQFTFPVQKTPQGDSDEIAPLYKQMMAVGAPKAKVVKKGKKSKKALPKRVDQEPELEMTETVDETSASVG